jgi:parallel beta-helix repeat protein
MKKKRKNMYKAIIAFAVAMAFLLPGSAAFANTMTSEEENPLNIINNKTEFDQSQTGSTTISNSNAITELTTRDPTTIYVDDDNTQGPWNGTYEYPYQYIQDAIDNGEPGDSVYIFNGLYNEGYQTHPSTLYEGLTAYKQGMSFTGESLGGVIIDPMHPSQMSGNAMFVTADDITLENIVFCNTSYAQFQFGLKLGGWDTRNQVVAQANNCIVMNCISENNQFGLYVEASSNVQLSNFQIKDNQFYGAQITGESSCTFTSCEILDTGSYQAVFIVNSPDCVFTDCTITGSGRDAVYLASSNGATFTNCDISTSYTVGNTNNNEMWFQYCPEKSPSIPSVNEDNTRQGTVSLKDQYENEIVVPADSIPPEIQYGMWLQHSFEDNTVLDTCMVNPNDHIQKRSSILAPPLDYMGLSLSGSEDIVISGCTISGGVSFEYCAYATISGTDITNGKFSVVGESKAEYDYTVDTTTVDGDDVYYLNGESGVTIDGIDVGYLAIVSSINITVKNMNMTGYAQGLVVLGCGEKTIRFRPPLIVESDDIDEMLAIIHKATTIF